MRKIDRRELLRVAVVALAAPAVRAEVPDPPGLTRTEREAIRWGETVSGLQAGLRVAHRRASYAVGDQIELVPYLRNRTSKPVQFTYDPAFYEKTPTVLGPDGKEVRVMGYTDLAAARAAIRVTLPAGETLIVDHPGLWLTTDRPQGGQFPGLPDPQPGVYRIAQNIRFGTSSPDRVTIRSRPVTLFSESGKPYRAEADIVPMSQGDTDGNLTTGTMEVNVRTGRGRTG
jgi:hypothetical protein